MPPPLIEEAALQNNIYHGESAFSTRRPGFLFKIGPNICNANEFSLTPEQLQTFKEALHDIARKIDETADKL